MDNRLVPQLSPIEGAAVTPVIGLQKAWDVPSLVFRGCRGLRFQFRLSGLGSSEVQGLELDRGQTGCFVGHRRTAILKSSDLPREQSQTGTRQGASDHGSRTDDMTPARGI